VLASHDLREPLRKIQLHADRIASAPALPAPVTEGLARVRTTAATMQRRVSDLLAYSRLATSFHPVESVDLASLVEEVIRELKSAYEDAGARIVVAALPVADLDPAHIRALFRQLLENALTFRREGVPLVVDIAARAIGEGRIELTVSDNGIGFEDEDRERIFAVFRTLHPRQTHGGTGIGLSTCRRIVELHGGEMTAHGRLGVGATFRIRLPLHHGADASCRPTPEPA
jgi:signal transduction histidine kinase